jgi:hypothetical protein
MRKKIQEKISFWQQFRKHWVEDTGFFTSFLILIFFVFVSPITIEYTKYEVLFINGGLLIIYLSGIFSCHLIGLRWGLIVLFIVLAVLKLIRIFGNVKDFYEIELGLASLDILVIIFLNLGLLFRNNEINFYRVLGAINVYLLVAVLGTLTFILLSLHIQPLLSGNIKINYNEKDFATFIYYCLVSMTTVGYGDIYPTHILAKQLSITLSTFGVLYPSVVIARLVSSNN